jgi:hypothetical protein
MPNLDIERLRKAITELETALCRGDENIYCLAFNEGKWQIRARVWYKATNVTRHRRCEILDSGIEVIDNLTDAEQAYAAKYVQVACGSSFRPSKAYQYRGCPYLTYFIKPIWEVFYDEASSVEL